MQDCFFQHKPGFLRKACTGKKKQEDRGAYRNRQDKINTPIRAFMANISNGSSQADTDSSIRPEISETFREQDTLDMEKI